MFANFVALKKRANYDNEAIKYIDLIKKLQNGMIYSLLDNMYYNALSKVEISKTK